MNLIEEMRVINAFKLTGKDKLEISARMTDAFMSVVFKRFKEENKKLHGKKLMIKFRDKFWKAIGRD